MNTVRSCLATTVAFLVVAIGWWAADAVVCCKSSSVATVGEDVIASCQNKNRTFHMVEAIGGGTCDDNRTAVPVRKCCPLGQTYDLSLDFCKPAELDGDAQSRRMMQKLRDVSRELDDAVMVGYNYGQPLCDAGYVLIDLPIKELLMESYRSGFGFLPGSCFDLTPSDELVALTCRTRDLYCGRGRYKCVPKCCKHNQMIVDAPNGPQCKQSMQSFKKYTYEKYYMLKEKNKTLLPYHVEFSCLHGGINRQWFILATDGRLYFVFDDLFIPDTEYCVDYSPVDNNIVALVCNDDPMFVITRPGNSIPLFYRASYVASVVCLALTLLVYNTLPSLRNVSSYYVKCYVGHQLVSHVCGIVQMSMKNIKGDACLIFGYITLFVFLSTLCWLNVIFFDLNWVIRCNMSTNRSTSTSIRTIMYHVYCWGISSIIVCTGFFSNQVRLSMSMYGCLFFRKFTQLF
ncbi:uncharacterized protein LOC100162913 [Acyrthosiphon pisum]|uniref:G-protein coupled receptors family 2 profile 2 domain-containing protein n=1 Tax=Acyrthosiphon pisum TaxID=7029 RepID=A0A8R2B7A4_ACYPI|nr:uncharacterized protein LOC100162913 [Acyrthosiphon pisum]|eukprot:XP_008184661.1 PREDICTED: uncharacterized protein LOC100162913 [Acyrthosiphon pisum]